MRAHLQKAPIISTRLNDGGIFLMVPEDPFAKLVAVAKTETVRAGGPTMKVERIRITDGGRRAIAPDDGDG
jgi:hypothetical protein